MPGFVLTALFLLLVSLGILWGLVVLATRRFSDRAKREVRTVAAIFLFFGVVIYCYLVVGILDAQFDDKDFWSPSEMSQLERYSQACEGPLAPGTAVADVRAWLVDEGIPDAENWDIAAAKRLYFREYVDEESVFHSIGITDNNVRNWSAFGDIAIVTNIGFEAGRVARCNARISKHGR